MSWILGFLQRRTGSPRMTGNSSSSLDEVKRRSEDPGETNVPLNNIIVEIFPHWISFFYESYFPLSHPMLEIFFSLNCWCHSIMTFIVYEIYNIIFICESFEMMIFMFKNSLNKVTCYTDIESTIFITCHDISTWLESSNTVFHIEDSICPGFSGQAREWRGIVRHPRASEAKAVRDPRIQVKILVPYLNVLDSHVKPENDGE